MSIEIIPIGGYSRIEGNSVAIKVDNEVVILDMGLSMENYVNYQNKQTELNKGIQRRFHYDELLLNKAVPDYNFLGDDIKNVKAVIPSHAHLDHVGAVAYGMKFFKNIPVIATPYTIEFIKRDIKNLNYDRFFKKNNIYLKTANLNSRVVISEKIEVEFIHTTHSVPDSAILAVHTPYGTVVYAVDYKFDNYPQIGDPPNFKRLTTLGKQGVKCLILESLYADFDIETPSEEDVRIQLRNTLSNMNLENKLIFTSTFSSHVVRLKSLIDAGQSLNRKVVLLGSSLNLHSQIAKKLKKLKIDENIQVLSSREQIKSFLASITNENRSNYFLICTGHQGEEGSVLSKIADGIFGFYPNPNDVVIFSSSVIPTKTNQKSFAALEKKLIGLNLHILKDIHASGHAGLKDHKKMLNILNPEYIIPAHAGHEKAKFIKNLSDEINIGKTILVTNHERIDLK